MLNQSTTMHRTPIMLMKHKLGEHPPPFERIEVLPTRSGRRMFLLVQHRLLSLPFECEGALGQLALSSLKMFVTYTRHTAMRALSPRWRSSQGGAVISRRKEYYSRTEASVQLYRNSYSQLYCSS